MTAPRYLSNGLNADCDDLFECALETTAEVGEAPNIAVNESKAALVSTSTVE